MRRAIMLAVAATLAGPGAAHAAYGVDDPGATKCALFLKMMEKGPRGTEYQFLSWAQGYAAGKGIAPVTRETMTKFEAACKATPDAAFATAVETVSRAQNPQSAEQRP